MNEIAARLAAPLDDNLDTPPPLSLEDKRLIVDQAIALFEGFYVHLPMKRSLYGVDPVGQLRLLRHQLDQIAEDRDFHARMTSIFWSVNDLHANYHLPPPYGDLVATLPFRVESCREGGLDIHLVSVVHQDVAHPHFKPGVTVTHWNGVPIARAVERSGEWGPGGNAAARKVRGADLLTLRDLGISPAPDEDWVTVSFIAPDGTVQEARLAWTVTRLPAVLTALDSPAGGGRHLGLDLSGAARQFVRKEQMAAGGYVTADRSRLAAGMVEREIPTDFTCFRARVVATSHGRLGYIRIWSFVPTRLDPAKGEQVVDSADFVDEFVRLLGQMPDSGLIIDVRDNTGGLIDAGERIIQTLTPRTVEPHLLQFVSTPQTRMLINNQPHPGGLGAWVPSVNRAVATGAAFTGAHPLTPAEGFNDLGQRYRGPVVLVTSARSYSATDIVAALFQDHEVGPILGVDGCTGAGGANVWKHSATLALMTKGRSRRPLPGCQLRPLPQGVEMTVAIRRSLRTGRNAGMEIEDLGVMPDHIHHLTRRDVLEGNVDLMEAAAGLLAGMPRRRLEARAEGGRQGLCVTVETLGLDRVDIRLDGRPVASIDVTDGNGLHHLAASGKSALMVLEGYSAGSLVAVNRLVLRRGSSGRVRGSTTDPTTGGWNENAFRNAGKGGGKGGQSGSTGGKGGGKGGQSGSTGGKGGGKAGQTGGIGG